MYVCSNKTAGWKAGALILLVHDNVIIEKACLNF